MRRAALMARVSSDEQAKGYSLDVQSEALEKYCLRNDIEIVYTFREDHSAKNFDRPAFKEFLEYAKRKKGTFDLLLFTSWDRFSRNAMDAYHMIDRLRRMGIEAQSIEQPIDFSVPENKMMLAMYLVMPEVDNDRRSIKIRGGIRAALKAGRWCRAAPFGYRNTRDMNNRPIIVQTEQAEPIRRAFQMIADGATQPEAREMLNSCGVSIQRSRFSEMLRNPMYMGMIEVPALDDEPYELIEGQHEGIVSRKLFYEVQRVLKGNRPNKRVKSSVINDVLPLRGILKCTSCGGKLTGSRSRARNGTRHAYYHCNHCGKQRYRADRMNQEMRDILNSWKFQNNFDSVYQRVVSDLLDHGEKNRSVEIKAVRKKISDQKQRLVKLQDKLIDGIISTEDYPEIRQRYSESLNDLEDRLDQLTEDNEDKRLMIRNALTVVNNLGNYFEQSDSKNKIKLLGSIFPEMIEFDGEKCRTTRLNQAVALCLTADKGYSQKENRILPQNLEVSGWVENTGFEPVASTLPV
jgi:site-specific DNA recombinase